jgi:hypothetical protein
MHVGEATANSHSIQGMARRRQTGTHLPRPTLWGMVGNGAMTHPSSATLTVDERGRPMPKIQLHIPTTPERQGGRNQDPRSQSRPSPPQIYSDFGVPIRRPRVDSEGKPIPAAAQRKSATQWDQLPATVHSFLASHNLTAGNWLSMGTRPCGICSAQGQCDHDWLHCVYLWALTPEGRRFLGDAKASQKAKLLLAGPGSLSNVSNLVQLVAQSGSSQVMSALPAGGDLVAAIQEVAGYFTDCPDDEDADELVAWVEQVEYHADLLCYVCNVE